LYHTGARYYDPRLGRFLQPDPIGQAGGVNLYAYVGNDPLNLTDPSGLWGIFGSWGLTGVVGSGPGSATIYQGNTPIAQVNGGVATAQVGAGAFYSSASGASAGGFVTAQAAITGLLPSGSTTVASVFPSQPNSQNGVLGASLGIGRGLGVTNANNASDLQGTSHVVQVDLGVVSIQYATGQASDGRSIWSLSAGGTLGLGLSSYDTETPAAGGVQLTNPPPGSGGNSH